MQVRRHLALWLALGLIVTACTGGGEVDTTQGPTTTSVSDPGTTAASEPTTPQEENGDTAAPEGTLLWDAVFGAPALDPHHLSQIVFGSIAKAMYDTLITFEGDEIAEPSPQLAESWDISDDFRTYTFHLRDDAVFSDGTPVTASDVVFSFDRMKNLQSLPSFRASGLEFEEVDDHTVVVHSEEPNPSLLVNLANYAFAVINSTAAQEVGAVAGEDAVTADTAQAHLDQNSLGSGPYVLVENDEGVRVVLEPNENYVGDRQPAFEQIVVRAAPSDTQILNVRAGESDLAMEISGVQMETVDTSMYDAVSTPATRQLFIFMNLDPEISPITANEDFREAVKYGLDYDSILEVAGEAQRTSFIPPMVPYGLDPSEFPQRDVERAISALERSGITDPVVEYFYASDNPQLGLVQDPIAQRIQANLAEVGITLDLIPLPQANVFPRLSQDHDVPMGQWAAAQAPDPSQFLIYCPDSRFGERIRMTPESHAELQELCDAAAAAHPDDAEEAYRALQVALEEQSPLVMLFNPTQQLVSRNTLSGAVYSPHHYLDLRVIGHRS